ncbi:MAG TPA: glycoside hydrolase family 20 zincin-like fold domain-containing protein, partial [Arenibacter sp.]|nr:glycoside hydrolase family 20 zincin-like fold domain-containing protein [Arenibacter sp.]
MACQQGKKVSIDFPATDLALENMIPKPLKVVSTKSAFGLDQNTVIHTSSTAEGFPEVGEFLSEKIKWFTELDIPVNPSADPSDHRVIFIDQADSTVFTGQEEYGINITQDSIILTAKTAEGAFRGVQTIRQLIPESS